MKYLLLVAAMFVPAISSAGVTIHYSGVLSDSTTPESVIEMAETYATSHKWTYQKEGEALTIFPDPWCEPMHLSFREKSLNSDFVKTQFAGPQVHIAVIGLLKAIEPSFSHLDVLDEGEYWKSGSMDKLKENMEGVDATIANIKKTHPEAIGPTKLPDGRIVDLRARK